MKKNNLYINFIEKGLLIKSCKFCFDAATPLLDEGVYTRVLGVVERVRWMATPPPTVLKKVGAVQQCATLPL
jgi:hypothetical protein